MISNEYRELNRRFHQERPDYGTSGQKYAAIVRSLAKRYQAKTILDYGCGKCTLSAALPDLEIYNYDPCIDGLDDRPSSADLVVCTDVLEHVELEYADEVIADLKRLAKNALYILVATGPACKSLPDGRNAHITIKSMEWWMSKFENMDLNEKRSNAKYFEAIFT